MIGAGFTYKGLGLLGDVKCSCPNCKRTKKIFKSAIRQTKYGYKLGSLAVCECGYSSNVIMKNSMKVDLSDTFKATCNECGSVLNFYSDDLKEQSAKGLKNLGQAFSAFRFTASERIEDFNKCSKCGSRKVIVELIEDVTIKNESLTDKLNNWSAEMRAKNKENQTELNRQFKEVTGGYNKKAITAIIISFVATFLFPPISLICIFSLIWFLVDIILKSIKFRKYMK
ncbi:hypothetical protein [Clostridium sp.]|uniref:hypothetical protein n=1 Tax=Clostridium sp. TaxID=1506 RepID=UPI00283ABCE2|nr:hypothetical protein [Clostridium sp.]MDR3598505.1 hypothetical protein [Clostridium sp.]